MENHAPTTHMLLWDFILFYFFQYCLRGLQCIMQLPWCLTNIFDSVPSTHMTGKTTVFWAAGTNLDSLPTTQLRFISGFLVEENKRLCLIPVGLYHWLTVFQKTFKVYRLLLLVIYVF